MNQPEKNETTVGSLPRSEAKWKGGLKLLLKIGVSGVCLFYVGRKIDWLETWQLLRQSSKGWLLLALLFFTASKVVASFRLNKYFTNISIHLGETANLRLYWLGMFYNLFLPGGIGGDAYKVILLNRRYENIIAKKITAAVLLDRISGVAGLGILAALFYCSLYPATWHGWLVAIAIIPGIAVFYFVVKKWFPSFVASFYPTLWLGLLVQGLQVVCAFFIMQSIGINHHFAAFQFLFLLSSIVAIFPFTIGGLGARELVFLWGATAFGFNKNEAVYISLLFYLITVLVSFVGLIWVYKNPLRAEDDR